MDALEGLPACPVIAELGVFAGDFSRCLLRAFDPLALFLVDPWTAGRTSAPLEERACEGGQLWGFVRETVGQDPRVHVMRMTFASYLISTPDESLDMVYLCGSHVSERRLRVTLELASKKVRPGGYVATCDCEALESAAAEFGAENTWSVRRMEVAGRLSTVLRRPEEREDLKGRSLQGLRDSE